MRFAAPLWYYKFAGGIKAESKSAVYGRRKQVLSKKKSRILIIISLGVTFIVFTLLGVGPFVGSKLVPSGGEPIATQDQINLYITTDSTEYGWDYPIGVI